jgi:hypothetical protein
VSDDFEYVRMATASYEDWTGNAVAEKSMAHMDQLYELFGLDMDSWWVLAIDAFASGRRDVPDWTVRVYAFDRAGNAANDYGAMMKIAEERGSVPVTEVLVHNVTLDDIAKLMKVTHIHLRDRNAPPNIDIIDRGDHPPQEN